MKRFLPLALALTLTSPAFAQDQSFKDLFKQMEQLSEQAQKMLEGWAEELGPKLDEMGPRLEALAEKLGDLSAYEPPEILENGDIIIRRKKLEPDQKKPDMPKATPQDKPTIDL